MSDFNFATPGAKSNILSGTSNAGRPFGVNAGSFADSSRETLEADMAVAAEGIVQALTRVTARQAQSATFMYASGEAANNGFSVDVEPPSIGGPHNQNPS
jgi:hypothetical protein